IGVVARRTGAAADFDVGQRPQALQQLVHSGQRFITTGAREAEAASRTGVFVHSQDPGTCASRGYSCRQSCRTGTDDEHIAETVALGCDYARGIELHPAQSAHETEKPLPARCEPLRTVKRL